MESLSKLLFLLNYLFNQNLLKFLKIRNINLIYDSKQINKIKIYLTYHEVNLFFYMIIKVIIPIF